MRWSLAELDEIAFGRGPERRIRTDGRRLAVELPDPWVSSRHATLNRVLGAWGIEDCKSRNGTLVNGVPVERSPLADGDLIELGQSFFIFREGITGADAPAVAEVDASQVAAAGLATLSPGFGGELQRVQTMARSRVPVVVRGESGTGKEMIASALHCLSGRTGTFQAVNCGSLPATLVESELFGFRRGTFSGATQDRPGLVRSAEGGTLFLDEIGDLPLPAQAALLRVLQEGEVLPLGATKPVKVDFRLVAATHRDLDALAESGRFRADLLARISGFTITLPPLRERREDIGLIVAELLRRKLGAQAAAVVFSPNAVRKLFAYPWPFNIRELDNCLEAAIVLSASGPVDVAHLPAAVTATPSQPGAPERRAKGAVSGLSDIDRKRREEIIAALRANNGNVSAAARMLGKARAQVQRWIKRYTIDPRSFRPSP
jgi:transcriptional regulator with GAF, ATPase, and Fis domain